MSIAYASAEPRLVVPYDSYNNPAAKVVGAGLVLALAEVLKEYDVALVSVVGGGLRAVVQVCGSTAVCPSCHQVSSRVWSRYWRTPEDVTSLGLHLQLRVRARRFRCENPACGQRIFAERLPDIPAWARRSDRVSTLLAYTALAVGGLPGRRVARLFGFNYSRHTLLRAARQVVMEDRKTVQVLGVDDYAYRRGVSYGTLLYDFGQHRVIDLLPERSAEFLVAWLKAHPGVEVISRDRGGTYAQGAREGAPNAIQVADRFHLMQNLGDCLEKIAQRGIRLEEQSVPLPGQSADVPQQMEPMADSVPPPARPPTRAEQEKTATHRRRQNRQDAILNLRQQGASIRTIAATLHLHRRTVRRYLLSLPDNARPRRPSVCDAYRAYLRQRWDEGVHNGHQLYQEIRAQGYTGSQSGLRHYLQPWRADLPPTVGSSRSRRVVPKPPKTRDISPRFFRRLVLKNLRTAEEEDLLTRIAASSSSLATSVSLAHEFASAIRAHDVAAFDAWLDKASAAGVPEWKGFVDGLRRDIDAVHNGITLAWSQGAVEGSINRLKLIKRAMYGRGGHDLLRRRVIFHLRD